MTKKHLAKNNGTRKTYISLTWRTLFSGEDKLERYGNMTDSELEGVTEFIINKPYVHKREK